MAHRVDLMMVGHHHSYQRTCQVRAVRIYMLCKRTFDLLGLGSFLTDVSLPLSPHDRWSRTPAWRRRTARSTTAPCTRWWAWRGRASAITVREFSFSLNFITLVWIDRRLTFTNLL